MALTNWDRSEKIKRYCLKINKKETYDKLKKKRDVHEKEMREMHEKGNTCVRKEA